MRVLTLLGTRPEIIRLSRIIPALDRHFDHVLAHTGQNFSTELSENQFVDLGLREPDHFLKAAGGTACETIARVVEATERLLAAVRPDAFVVLGDTNSALGVIAAKKHHVPIFHLEAGNRCFDARVPEETNRVIVDHVSDINLTYTERARDYLLAEGLRGERVICVGSPLYEVLAYYAPRISGSDALDRYGVAAGEYVVASAHREENVDDPVRLRTLLRTLRSVAKEFAKPVLLSVHPRTRKRLEALGGDGVESEGLRYADPLPYTDYVALQKSAFCTVSDSGTVTEEAAMLGFPAVTIRESHERPEGTDFGVLVMTGIGEDDVMRGIRIVTSARSAEGASRAIPPEYTRPDVSGAVARIISGYVQYVNRVVWHKVRR